MRDKIYYLFAIISMVFFSIFTAVSGLLARQAEYLSSDTRDPFEKQLPQSSPAPQPVEIPLLKEPVVAPVIVVEGLIAGGPVPQVIIGGRIFRVGDKVKAADKEADAIITDITKEGIEVVYKLEKFSYPAPSRALAVKREEKNEK